MFFTGMDRNIYKRAICFFVALTTCFGDIVFINGGPGVVFFINIMQDIGGMAADAVGCFLGTQAHQLAVYGPVIAFHSR